MHPAELAELEAVRDLYAVAAASLGARMAELGGALCIRLDADRRSAMFNRVLGLGLAGDRRARRPRAPQRAREDA